MGAYEQAAAAADEVMGEHARHLEARALERMRRGPEPGDPLVVQLVDGSLAEWPSGRPVDLTANPFAPFLEAFETVAYRSTS